MKFFMILSCFVLAGVFQLSAQVASLEGTVSLDGKLDEAAWKLAVPQSGFSLLKSRNKKNLKPEQTEFRVLADAKNLYIGIRCSEPDMKSLTINAQKGSENIWADDSVEVFLAPCGRKENFYQFVITAGNVTWCQYYEEAGNVTPEDFGAAFDSAVFIGRNFWSVEVRIPWNAFYHTPSHEWKEKWLFNVVRTRIKPREYSSWSPLISGYREPGYFRTFSGFPKKSAEQGISIGNVNGKLEDMKQENYYTGLLQIPVNAEKAIGGLTLSIVSDGIKTISGKPVSLNRKLNMVEVPAVFTKTGKNTFYVELKNAKGECIAERYSTVNIKYDPIKIIFDKPFYSQCFYPGQDFSRISGTVIVSAKVPFVTLSAGNKSYRLALKAGKAVFDIPNPVKEGSVILNAFIEKDGKRTAGQSAEIKILKPSGRKMVWIEKPGRLVINGKREFGLGWYGGAGRGGFLISEAFAEKYPSPAAKHPYNVDSMILIAPPSLLRSINTTEYERDIYPSEKAIQVFLDRIKKNRNRDFIYYYLADEPEFHGVSSVYLEHVYKIIKKEDPYHPVMIITTTPNKFINCADILNPHPYIKPMINDKGKRLLGRPVNAITDSARLFLKANRKDKLLFGTPQLFNYRHVNQYAVFPTFDETNAWIWGLICCGGQGLTPFIYYDHASRPDLDFGMDYIYFSIDRLAPYLTAPVEPLAGSVDNRNVEQRLIGTEDGVLLILSNTSPEKQKVTFQSPALKKYESLNLFREPGTQKIQQGKFSMEMAPYQVRIFSSRKLDKGLSSMAEFRRKVAEAEKERCSSPSILFEKGHRIEISTCQRVDTDTCVIEDKLFDGVRDIFAFRPKFPFNTIWLEFGFRKFTAKFSKMRLYGWKLEEPEFSILKYGEWIKLNPVSVKKGKYFLELDFGQTYTTVKCRVKWKKGSTGFELYEFELIP